MPKTPAPSVSKISLWITMLLVWNIALLSIAIFYLFRITQNIVSSQDIAQACAEQFSSSSQ